MSEDISPTYFGNFAPPIDVVSPSNPSQTVLANGEMALLYQGADGWEVQLFNDAGVAIDTVAISPELTGPSYNGTTAPEIIANPSGGFLIAQYQSGGPDVLVAATFDSSGNQLTSWTTLVPASQAANYGDSIAALANGGYAVSWGTTTSGSSGGNPVVAGYIDGKAIDEGDDVFTETFSSTLVGSSAVGLTGSYDAGVSDLPYAANNQQLPDIATLTNGSVVDVYFSYMNYNYTDNPFDTGTYGAIQFTLANGTPVVVADDYYYVNNLSPSGDPGGPLTGHLGFDGGADQSVVALSDGQFAVLFYRAQNANETNGPADDYYNAVLYNADGSVAVAETNLATVYQASPFGPQAVALPDGGFAMTYINEQTDGSAVIEVSVVNSELQVVQTTTEPITLYSGSTPPNLSVDSNCLLWLEENGDEYLIAGAEPGDFVIDDALQTTAQTLAGTSTTHNFLRGSTADDTFSVAGGTNVLVGGGGTDTFVAGVAADQAVISTDAAGDVIVTTYAAPYASGATAASTSTLEQFSVVTFTNGTLEISGTAAAETLSLAADMTLQLASPTSSTETFALAASSALALETGDTLGATVSGMSPGDSVDFAAVGYASGDVATFTSKDAGGGVVSVTTSGGVEVASFALDGTYASNAFFVAADGSGLEVTEAYSVKTKDPGGAYDIHYYGYSGVFHGVDYASYDVAFNASKVKDLTTYYDANDDVVASESFQSNGGFTITLDGVVTQTKAVNADQSYQIANSNISGKPYTSDVEQFSAGGVKLSEEWYAGSTPYQTEDWNADGSRAIDHLDTSSPTETSVEDIYAANGSLLSVAHVLVGGSVSTNLDASNLTVSASSGAVSLSVANAQSGTDMFALPAESTETFVATSQTNEAFDLSSGFGDASVRGLVSTGAGADGFLFQAAMFGYSSSTPANVIDASILSQKQSGNSFVISDLAGDTVTLDGINKSKLTASLSANPSLFQFD